MKAPFSRLQSLLQRRLDMTDPEIRQLLDRLTLFLEADSERPEDLIEYGVHRWGVKVIQAAAGAGTRNKIIIEARSEDVLCILDRVRFIGGSATFDVGISNVGTAAATITPAPMDSQDIRAGAAAGCKTFHRFSSSAAASVFVSETLDTANGVLLSPLVLRGASIANVPAIFLQNTVDNTALNLIYQFYEVDLRAR